MQSTDIYPYPKMLHDVDLLGQIWPHIRVLQPIQPAGCPRILLIIWQLNVVPPQLRSGNMSETAVSAKGGPGLFGTQESFRVWGSATTKLRAVSFSNRRPGLHFLPVSSHKMGMKRMMQSFEHSCKMKNGCQPTLSVSLSSESCLVWLSPEKTCLITVLHDYWWFETLSVEWIRNRIPKIPQTKCLRCVKAYIELHPTISGHTQ